jgi:flagellar hook-basal body complex protein FliE
LHDRYSAINAESFNRLLKNIFEAADARQKQAKKQSLSVINEHFKLVFNTAAATQIVFQRLSGR